MRLIFAGHRADKRNVTDVSDDAATGWGREAERLRALHSTCLLDSPPEQIFDELTELAAQICGMPVAMITLLDADRQWFKSKVGTPLEQTPREHSFCNYTIAQDDLLIVYDASEDRRFGDHPLVIGEPYVRFYAGYPLSTGTGEKLGSLCVIDFVPRELTELQQSALRVLARQVMAQIELKQQVMALDDVVQESRRIARELEASQQRFRAFMDASPAAAFIKDGTGRMLYCNRGLTEKYGASPADWIGRNDFEIWPHAFALRFRNADLRVFERNELLQFEDDTPTPSGRVVTWSVSKFPLRDAAGNMLLAGMAVDVTKEREVERELRRYQKELQEANSTLRRLSLTDGLTRLRNRRAFEEMLEREFARSRRSLAPMSLMMLDIDDFKGFNDTFGHVQGDQVLRKIARLLRREMRKSDMVARYGGEEFAAILPDTNAEEALHLANRLCRRIARTTWEHRAMTVSIGVGMLLPDTSTPYAFVEAVDAALYRAKRSGKNRACLEAGSEDAEERYAKEHAAVS